mgnify:CR=1 FL=1
MKNHELLFELSHPHRIHIISLLKSESLRLSDIAEKIGISTPEILRHINRLLDAKIIFKDQKGYYSLSSLSHFLFPIIDTTYFLSKNLDFVFSHDFSVIPAHLRQRMNVLSDAEISSGAMHILHGSEVLMNDAEEYLWIMSPQYLSSSSSIISEKITKGIEFRLLFPKCYHPPFDFQEIRGVTLHAKQLKTIDFVLFVTDNSAGLLLPDLQGKIDFEWGLGGSVRNVIDWMGDLFNYYWEKADNIQDCK